MAKGSFGKSSHFISNNVSDVRVNDNIIRCLRCDDEKHRDGYRTTSAFERPCHSYCAECRSVLGIYHEKSKYYVVEDKESMIEARVAKILMEYENAC